MASQGGAPDALHPDCLWQVARIPLACAACSRDGPCRSRDLHLPYQGTKKSYIFPTKGWPRHVPDGTQEDVGSELASGVCEILAELVRHAFRELFRFVLAGAI